jgi:flagellar basal-body rod protein FlgB
MAISDVPILSMLRQRMQWHQERQRVLAENVSNSDTPGFQARDLRDLDFRNSTPRASAVSLVRSDPGHFGSSEGTARFELDRNSGGDVRPTGNGVNLEDEMMKVAQNQMDFQAATALYGRSLGLLKTALGKR